MRIVGIYCYRDKTNGEIVYIGKDSDICKNKRHKEYFQKCRYFHQVINRVLQNNPDKYKYEVLKSGDFKENLLNALEIIYIRRYNPKFCYTVGGDGFTGKHSEATKRKISEAMKGKNKGKSTWLKGKSLSDEYKLKISEAKKYKYAKIIKFGKTSNGKQMYAIRKDGKRIKFSINLSKLLKWFTKEYPKEILILNNIF